MGLEYFINEFSNWLAEYVSPNLRHRHDYNLPYSYFREKESAFNQYITIFKFKKKSNTSLNSLKIHFDKFDHLRDDAVVG